MPTCATRDPARAGGNPAGACGPRQWARLRTRQWGGVAHHVSFTNSRTAALNSTGFSIIG